MYPKILNAYIHGPSPAQASRFVAENVFFQRPWQSTSNLVWFPSSSYIIALANVFVCVLFIYCSDVVFDQASFLDSYYKYA